jgi:hypothetical protein
MSYGEKIYQDYGEEMIETNRERARLASWAGTKLWMVDIFPVCKLHLAWIPVLRTYLILVQYTPAWFPGATFRRFGDKFTELSSKVRLLGYNLVERNMVSEHFHSMSGPSLVRDSSNS